MQSFTRGNLIEVAATFASADNPSADASSAEVRLAFLADGAPAAVTLPMAKDSGGPTWRARWDSTAGDGGTVDYVVRCAGNVVAAAQGVFRLWSNDANTN